MTKDYNSMTLKQLEKLARELAKTRAKLATDHKLVAAAIEVKLAEKSAAEKLDAMSPAERMALEKRIGSSGTK